MPVFLTGINTSSVLAMEMCGIDRDDEDDIYLKKDLEIICRVYIE